VSAADLGLPEPKEEGSTLEENAIIKAVTYARLAGLPTIAEDTGLEVEALGGAPGVLSSRFSGKEKDYAANNRKLLELLEGVEDRRARFRTVAVLALPDGRFWKSEGILEGEIARSPRGTGGFGYDPVFIPRGETRTLAELLPAEKNAISHRRKALEGLRPLLRVLVENPGLLR
ncbi:MAG: RdgB/HAM1 family non-canonical purine NTP pyrophosphatase, partial [Candidatus Bipolaricaulaceae bacterium]